MKNILSEIVQTVEFFVREGGKNKKNLKKPNAVAKKSLDIFAKSL